MSQTKTSIMNSLVSICKGVSLVKSVTTKNIGINEAAQAASPIIIITGLNETMTYSVSQQTYFTYMVKIKIKVPRDGDGSLLHSITQKIQDAIDSNPRLNDTCDYCIFKLNDPAITLDNSEKSLFLEIHYRRSR